MSQPNFPLRLQVAEESAASGATLNLIHDLARSAVACFLHPRCDAEAFGSQIAGERVFVARWSGAACGYASVWEAEPFLHHLYVLPGWQRRGVGSGLLQTVLARFGPSIWLKCECANEPALAFYRRQGWTERSAGVGADGAWVGLGPAPTTLAVPGVTGHDSGRVVG